MLCPFCRFFRGFVLAVRLGYRCLDWCLPMSADGRINGVLVIIIAIAIVLLVLAHEKLGLCRRCLSFADGFGCHERHLLSFLLGNFVIVFILCAVLGQVDFVLLS